MLSILGNNQLLSKSFTPNGLDLVYDDVMAFLILVRHGQTDYNLQKLFSGKTDIPLNQTGINEAINAAKKLSDIVPDIGYTSELDRAKKTLGHILDENGHSIEVIASPALNERDYGDFEGKSKEDVLKTHGEEMLKKVRRSWDHKIPGGETLKDVYRRIAPFYDEVILPNLVSGKNVIVSSHNNTLRALIKHIEHINDSDIESLELGNAELRIYEISSDGKILNKIIR